jgi:FixJ family two-component response regulator
LAAENVQLPIIFIAGYGDSPTPVRAMKAGAVEAPTFRDQDLLDAVGAVLEKNRARQVGERRLAKLRSRFETLIVRERQGARRRQPAQEADCRRSLRSAR